MSTITIDDTITARGLVVGDRIHVPGESVPRVVREVNHGPDGFTSVRIGSDTFYSFRTSSLIHVLGRANRAPSDWQPSTRPTHYLDPFNQPDDPQDPMLMPTGIQYARPDDAGFPETVSDGMTELPPHRCFHPKRYHLVNGRRTARAVDVGLTGVLPIFTWVHLPRPIMTDRALDPHGAQWWHQRCPKCKAALLMKSRWRWGQITNSMNVTYDGLVYDKDGPLGRRGNPGRIVNDRQAVCVVSNKTVPYRLESGEDADGNPTFVTGMRRAVFVMLGTHIGERTARWKDRETGKWQSAARATKLIDVDLMLPVADEDQGQLLVDDLTRSWQLEQHRNQGGLPGWDEPTQSESPDWDPSIQRLMLTEHSAPADDWEDRQLLP